MFKRIAKTAFVILPLWAAWPPNASASMIKFKDSSVHAPKLGRLDLYHSDDEGYSVFMKGEYKSIPKYSVSPELRSLTSSQLNRYQDAAFLTVNEQSDGELSLKSHVRGEAGGPMAAQAAYFAVKGGLYAALGVTVAGTMAVTSSVVGSTTLVAGGAKLTAGALAKGTAATVVGSVVGTAALPTTSAAIGTGIATGVAGIVGGAEAATVVGSLATGVSAVTTTLATSTTLTAGTASTGVIAGATAATIAYIESISMAAYWAAFFSPWTPW